MVTVSIKFAPRGVFLYGRDSTACAELVRNALAKGLYVEGSAEFNIATGLLTDVEDIAEEVFDLTNNPSRQEEREKVYGNGRSLSSGDVVIIGERKVVCLPLGWKEL